MTMTHKLTLAAIAAFCIVVIAANTLTSGNRSDIAPAAMVETDPLLKASASTPAIPALPPVPARRDVSLPATGDAQPSAPLTLGPGTSEPRGLNDLVQEIRQEINSGENSGAAVAAPAQTRRLESVAAPDADAPALNVLKPIDAAPATEIAESSSASALPAETVQAIPGASESGLPRGEETPSLTLGPSKSDLSAVTLPDDRREEAKQFADIPVEVELPPVTDQPAGDAAVAGAVEEAAARGPVADAKGSEAKTNDEGPEAVDSKSDAKTDAASASAQIDPPGSRAQPAETSPAEKTALASANVAAQVDVPPPAAANVPAAATSIPPRKEAAKPAPAKAAPANGTTDRTYIIQPGDTFSSVAIVMYGAERHWIEIADANPDIDPKKLKVGQVLKLPALLSDRAETADKSSEKKSTDTNAAAPAAPAAAAAKAGPAPAKAAEAAEKTHDVKAGENLSTISRKYFNTADHWRHIYLTNRQAIGGDPSKLQAGMKLKITTPE